MSDNLLPPEIAKEVEFESICDSVAGRSIYTYLPRGSKLNGHVLKNASEQFGDNGDDLEHNSSTWSNESKDAYKFLEYPGHTKGAQPILVTMWDEIDPAKSDKVIFSIGGMQEEAKTQHRGDIPYNLFVEMPREKATRLIEMIKQDPILVERFYQNTFADLDSKPDEDTGLRRIKTDDLWIINIKEPSPLDTAVKLKLPEKVGVRR